MFEPPNNVAELLPGAPPPPISQLPAEILEHIFWFGVSDDISPRILCHVCHFWRDTAQSSPQLWTQFEVTNPYEVADHLKYSGSMMIQASLVRSEPFPPDIHLPAMLSDPLDRLGGLRIDAPESTLQEVLDILGSNLPVVYMMALSQTMRDSRVPEIPVQIKFSAPNLLWLQLARNCVYVEDVLSLLASARKLQRFECYGVRALTYTPDVYPELQQLVLPELHSMQLGGLQSKFLCHLVWCIKPKDGAVVNIATAAIFRVTMDLFPHLGPLHLTTIVFRPKEIVLSENHPDTRPFTLMFSLEIVESFPLDLPHICAFSNLRHVVEVNLPQLPYQLGFRLDNAWEMFFDAMPSLKFLSLDAQWSDYALASLMPRPGDRSIRCEQLEHLVLVNAVLYDDTGSESGDEDSESDEEDLANKYTVLECCLSCRYLAGCRLKKLTLNGCQVTAPCRELLEGNVDELYVLE